MQVQMGLDQHDQLLDGYDLHPCFDANNEACGCLLALKLQPKNRADGQSVPQCPMHGIQQHKPEASAKCKLCQELRAKGYTGRLMLEVPLDTAPGIANVSRMLNPKKVGPSAKQGSSSSSKQMRCSNTQSVVLRSGCSQAGDSMQYTARAGSQLAQKEKGDCNMSHSEGYAGGRFVAGNKCTAKIDIVLEKEAGEQAGNMLGIEMQGHSHKRAKQQQADKTKEQLAHAAQIPLLSVNIWEVVDKPDAKTECASAVPVCSHASIAAAGAGTSSSVPVDQLTAPVKRSRKPTQRLIAESSDSEGHNHSNGSGSSDGAEQLEVEPMQPHQTWGQVADHILHYVRCAEGMKSIIDDLNRAKGR